MAEERELFSIMVTSGTEDKLMAVATIANGAVAMDYDVHIFLAFWATHAFRKSAPQNLPLREEGKHLEEKMRSVMKEKGIPDWRTSLRKAKELGNVKIIVCSNMIKLFDIPEDDFIDLVDEISGIASYIDAATKAKANIQI